MSGFNDDMVTFSFIAKSLAGVPTGYGNVAAGADLVVTVFGAKARTSRPFRSQRIGSSLIDEGDTNTVAIIADGKLGPEVGSVMVSMSGDAMLSLWQGEGHARGRRRRDVSQSTLGDSANTILTISADSDAALEDGMTSSATLSRSRAPAARSSATAIRVPVTVNGSTAVAALPLLAQLLLAPVPDGRRRAAVSSAQRIAPSS